VRSDGSVDDDRWIAIAGLDDAAWRGLSEALAADGEAWAASADLLTVSGRLARSAELDRRLSAWTRTQRAEDLEERLQGLGVPAGLVANAEDLSADAQLRARGYFTTVPTPEGDSQTFDGVPFVSADLTAAIAAPGPLLGEHTDRVLSGVLGLADEEIARLREEGVIA
jgi:crotonobetainyl-CoA:carnitine CoA-transferase CaiB-like acyl-CoA transferase